MRRVASYASQEVPLLTGLSCRKQLSVEVCQGMSDQVLPRDQSNSHDPLDSASIHTCAILIAPWCLGA